MGVTIVLTTCFSICLRSSPPHSLTNVTALPGAAASVWIPGSFNLRSAMQWYYTRIMHQEIEKKYCSLRRERLSLDLEGKKYCPACKEVGLPPTSGWSPGKNRYYWLVVP